MKTASTRLAIMAASGTVAVVSMILQAATAPAWWTARGVISTNNVVTNDFAAVNQGQLKWMAVNAAMELESQLPGGAGSNVWTLISSFTDSNNFRPVNLGQLKYVAQPFWSNLIAVGYATNYPWSGQANDFALANIGQMKNVFSFDAAWWMTLDTDEDGIPDWWMFQNFGHTTGQSNDLSRAEDDPDADESNNYTEYLVGTNPHDPNSMPGNNPVKVALDTLTYSRINLFRALIGLTPTAWMFQTNNTTRITQAQTSLTEIITNCVGNWIDGEYTKTKWTLSGFLNFMSNQTGNTSGNWLQGPLSNQVAELHWACDDLTAGKLRWQCAVTYEGTGIGWFDEENYPDYPVNFTNWTVTAAESAPPSQWPTNWISTFIELQELYEPDPRSVYGYEGYVDDCLTVNALYAETNGYSSASYLDVTADWRLNANNDIHAYDLYWDEYFCSPFNIAHLLNVPNVNLRFQAKTNEVNHGFDPTGAEPWTSVGVGSTNQIVQLVIYDPYAEYPSDIELVVRASDTNNVKLTSATLLNGTNDLTIIGLLPTTNAVIEVRARGMTNAIAALHVMVLPWITNSIGIYRIVDTNSCLTSPVGGPAATNIINEFNSVYAQACVQFVLTNADTADTATHLGYDSLPLRIPDRLPRSGAMESGEEPEDLDNDSLWSGQGRVFLFREGRFGTLGGYTRDIGKKWSVVFTHNTNPRTSLAITHEVGHQLKLSTRNDDGKHHDQGVPPLGTGAQMRRDLNVPPPNPEGRWMRWQDWKRANDEADKRTQ